MPRYYKRKTYRRKRVYKRKASRTYRPSKKLRTVVKNIVSRTMETKANQYTSAGVDVFGTISNTNVLNIIPGIAQGTGQSNRIGNRIKPVRFTLRDCSHVVMLILFIHLHLLLILIFIFLSGKMLMKPVEPQH